MRRTHLMVAALLIMAAVVLSITVLQLRPRHYDKNGCSSVKVASELLPVANSSGSLVIVSTNLKEKTSSYAELQMIGLKGLSKPARKPISRNFPVFYFVHQPHILKYRIISGCGSYAEGIRFVW